MKNQLVIITPNNLIILESFFVLKYRIRAEKQSYGFFLYTRLPSSAAPQSMELNNYGTFIFRYKGHHPYLGRAKHGFSLDLDYRFKYILD